MYKTIAVCMLGALVGCASNNDKSNAPSGQNGQNNMTNDNNSSSMNKADQEFVRKAAHGGMAEVQEGQLAQQRASSDQVRQFAQQMVTDHTQANDELKQLASQKGIAVPSDLGKKGQAQLDELNGLQGKDFDNKYVENQVKAHEDTVKLFQDEASNGQDSDLKAFASRTLPTLQHHLDMVKNLQSSHGASEMNSSDNGNNGGNMNGGNMNGGNMNGGANPAH